MKIDPRISEEFGTNLPYPSRTWLHWAIDNYWSLTISVCLMALGALCQLFVPYSWKIFALVGGTGLVGLVVCVVVGLMADSSYEVD
jgi:cytochrome c oxidase subunit IV